MKAPFRSLFFGLAVAGFALSAAGAHAASASDKRFFQQIAGQWSGPGEIVAGKYKGTKFNCNLAGASGQAKAGMSLDGACRVGMFSEKVSARIERAGAGYVGHFMDGAKGKGLDVIGGNVVGDSKVILTLNRAQLDGAMIARLKGDNGMVVTVSVKVNGKMVPVIGMNLKRVDGVSVGSVAVD